MKSRRPIARLVASGGLLAALLVVGGMPTGASRPHSSPPEQTDAERVFADMAALGPDQQDALVAAAQSEGSVSVYTSMTPETADAVAAEFNRLYEIDVEMYRAGSETLVTRIAQESDAGRTLADIVDTGSKEMVQLSHAGVFASYAGPEREDINELGLFEDWTATRFQFYTPAWNTDLVAEGEEPTSYEDLAAPEWDGEAALELSDYNWYATMYLYFESEGKSDEEIDSLFEGLASGAPVVDGHTRMNELLIAGQFQVAVTPFGSHIAMAAASGAPVSNQPYIEPIVAGPSGVALMREAPHPAAAYLYVQWMLSESGQTFLQSLGQDPALAGLSEVLDGDLTVIGIDAEALYSDGDEWSARYDELLRDAG